METERDVRRHERCIPDVSMIAGQVCEAGFSSAVRTSSDAFLLCIHGDEVAVQQCSAQGQAQVSRAAAVVVDDHGAAKLSSKLWQQRT